MIKWILDEFGALYMVIAVLLIVVTAVGGLLWLMGKGRALKVVVTAGVVLLLTFIVINIEPKEKVEEDGEVLVEDGISTTGTLTMDDGKGEEDLEEFEDEGEGTTIHNRSMAYTYEELRERVGAVAEELGYEDVNFVDVEYKFEENDIVYSELEWSNILVTTTITKEDRGVSRVMIEIEGEDEFTEEDKGRLLDVIELYVQATDEDTEDTAKGYFLGSMLSVKNGESMEFTSNDNEYSIANSENKGLMFFISGTRYIN